VELIVKVLNINPGYNDELKKNCPILNEYMIFVEKVRAYCKDIEAGSISEEEQKKAIGKAALKAVNWCIEHHVLEDFLTKNKRQVIIMSIFEFNDEIWEQVREDDRKFAREDGIQDGIQEGLQQGLRQGISLGNIETTIRISREYKESDERICERIIKDLGYTPKQAMDAIRKYDETVHV
jgi:flagellar biosynthesis/type III secretory pathway protein FliH